MTDQTCNADPDCNIRARKKMQTVIAPEVTKGLGTSKKIYKGSIFSDNTLATAEHNQ